MPIRDNVNKNDYKYSVFTKEPIFEVDGHYMIATHVSDVWESNNSLYVEAFFNNAQKSTLKFTLFENNILNIKYYQKEIDKRYYDKTFKNLKLKTIKYQNLSHKIVIDLNNNEKIVINKKPFKLSLIDANENVKIETSLRTGFGFLDGFSNPPLGFKQKNGELKPYLSLQLGSQELIYGLGEKFTNFVKNGTQSVIQATDPSILCNGDYAYGGIPLVYSTKNWGLLLNTSHKTTWEIGSPTTDALCVMSDEECLDLVLFTGDSIKELVSQYTKLTGRISGVPDVGYGIWVNRLYYHNRKELFTEIENSIKYDFPMDIFSLDPKWLKNRFTKTCNFVFNDDQFGDAEQLFKDVHDKGFKMCFWINPYLQIDNSDTWKEAFEKGYYIKKADGSVAHIWAGPDKYQENATAVDLTNPDAYNWWKEKIKDYLKLGLDIIKTDYGDSIDENAVMFNGELGKNFRNAYIELYLKAAYEALTEIKGNGEGFSLARPAYIGTQQYVGKWAGDPGQTFSELKLQLLAGLSSSLNGVVMWGTDIGGFSNIGNDIESDLFVRWSQFGLLTTFSRYHGIGAKEPWYFTKKELDIIRECAFLKRQLLPYYKQYEKEAIKKGLPIMRPLVLEFQDDTIAQKIDNQFMLGENLMVAPILENKARSRQVYFPKGKWIDFFDKTVYEGNKLYTIECPLNKTLLFAKSGCEIPLIENKHFKYDNIKNEKIILIKF